MNTSTVKTKVLEEIDLVPEDKLPQVYDFIHYFRLGLETSRGDTDRIMQFAGCWQDMPDDMFAEFLEEVAKRRERAFSRRRGSETVSG